MEKTKRERPGGVSAAQLWMCGMICLLIGYGGRCILQGGVLGFASGGTQQLLSAYVKGEGQQKWIILAMFVEGLGACAGPFFAFLLVKGFCQAETAGYLLLKMLCLALICEVPYDLAFNGSYWAMGSQNPVFGLVLGVLLMMFYRCFLERKISNGVIKLLLTASAALWAAVLGIDDGVFLVVLVAVIWRFRDQYQYRDVFGGIAGTLCAVTSPCYIVSPLAFFMIHRYNGESGHIHKPVRDLAYPVLLVICCVVARFAAR